MKIILEAEDRILLQGVPGKMTIEAPTEEQTFSPFHMLAGSLATCTYSVLLSWAQHADLSTAELEIAVDWKFEDDPHRLGAMRMELRWPNLPEGRRVAAERAAKMCTVHRALEEPVHVTTELAQ